MIEKILKLQSIQIQWITDQISKPNTFQKYAQVRPDFRKFVDKIEAEPGALPCLWSIFNLLENDSVKIENHGMEHDLELAEAKDTPLGNLEK